MLEKLKRWLSKQVYSPETSFQLNRLTLQIKDSEIRDLYDDHRTDSFQRLFKPTIFLNILFLIYRIVYCALDDFNNEKIQGVLVQLGIIWFILLVWTVMNYRFKKYAPMCMLIIFPIYGIMENLNVRGMTHPSMQLNDRLDSDYRFIEILICFTLLNYNTFRVTLCVFPFGFLLPYYFQL